ncbi:MAG: translation initiation factor 2 subunit gamma [Promethearchaeota archaeon CR_4]|nr:MAG: translation initiation factor 2 subunit gamma [Candidatus Lokiarchaeota archaeon CR_4]
MPAKKATTKKTARKPSKIAEKVEGENLETQSTEGTQKSSTTTIGTGKSTQHLRPTMDRKKIKPGQFVQSEMNLGTSGHVDHGKTTLTAMLSGEWTDRHSEEVRRGISIKLGYADAVLLKCPKCSPPECFWTEVMVKKALAGKEPKNPWTCPKCGGSLEFLRRISFVDSPGHETLMAVMLSGVSLMDGALLLIAADEKCPQPQTREHLAALQMSGVQRIVVVQNKIDTVTKEQAIENFKQIKAFIKGTVAENAPVVPISAIFNANIDLMLQYINDLIPTPVRTETEDFQFFIARSFDVNRPGTEPQNLRGGVVGGSVLKGTIKNGDEIEIKPGTRVGDKWVTLTSKIVSLSAGSNPVEVAHPGGLIGMMTQLDPSISKSDRLIGNVAGKVGTLPPLRDTLVFKANLLKEVVGIDHQIDVIPLRQKEPLMINAGTATTSGIITKLEKGRVTVELKRPVCVETGSRIAISRLVEKRFRLIGQGVILE